MIQDDFALPDGSEADYLLSGLARLIDLRGAETFLGAPLLLPEPHFFPDPVPARGNGVAVLLRRLLAYAEIEPRRLDIHIYPSESISSTVTEHGGQEAAAWFIGEARGVYRFGVREDELRDEMALVGTLGHEVAHAFRSHHALQAMDHDLEEKLTDLTTVYLGFGVFTLISSHQFKTGHYDRAGQKLLYEQQTRGYLLPGQLAFLLASQLVARDPDGELTRAVSQALPANHAAALARAVERLARDRSALLRTLRLPPPSQWPLPSPVRALAALPAVEVKIHDAIERDRTRSRVERVAFRVAGNFAGFGLAFGGASGFAAAVSMRLNTGFWLLTLGASLAGFAAGRKWTAPRCSSCSRRVSARADQCSRCSTPLVGDISVLDDRIAAEEDYRARQRAELGETSSPAEGTTVRCPACHWQPSPDDTWACDCGCEWHTFETRGVCPDCDREWEQTGCLACEESSPHALWYVLDPKN